MKQVDELIYDAITADETLMAIIGGRVVSTCFEIPPDELDNTPIPNIIITDDGMQNNVTTKDCVWEGAEDQVQVTVDIAAASPSEVKQIMRKVRKAVEVYMASLGNEMPTLVSLTAGDLAWDWMKPCYYKPLIYQCITKADIEDEEENI
jgi:hypothetical protein